MSSGEALLLRQLATEVLVVLDDPGDFGVTSSMLSALTETEQRRDAPRERTLQMLLPSMSEDGDDAARMRALTEDLLRREKSVRLRSIVSDLDHIVHGESDTLVVRPESDAQRIEELAMREPTGERSQTVAAIYMLVTWWQDSLLEAVNNSE